MDLLIRESQEKDDEILRKLNEQVWLDTYPNSEYGITGQDLKSYFNRTSGKKRKKNISNCKRFVAEVNGEIVGYCTGCVRDAYNQLKAIYILQECQGKGIGRALFTELASKFFDVRMDTVVHVAVYNQKAINAYKKWGFTDTGKRFEEERFCFESGSSIPEMEMLKKSC